MKKIQIKVMTNKLCVNLMSFTVLVTVHKVCTDYNNSVFTQNGIIIGNTEIFNGKKLRVFLGIPYAEPPVGRLRFKRPLPLRLSSKTIEAIRWPPACYQKLFVPKNFHNPNLSEDCLYLNIWTPVDDIPVPTLKAVMFWIHGGGFHIGSSSEYYASGHVLAAMGDVVVVTINYRVNTFGFLYTGTDEAPGNMGLWDQALALEWVNNNIRHFGGDVNRITVFGSSAGSWSASLLILSPVTRRLFQNAIMMSGAATNRMAGDEPSNVLRTWLLGAQAVNCTTAGEKPKRFTQQMIECLQSRAPEQLAAIPFMPKAPDTPMTWMSQVVIDKQFLPQKPMDMLKSGHFKQGLNLMLGVAEDEGSFNLALVVDRRKYHWYSPPNMTYSEAYNELRRISSQLVSKAPIDGEEVAKLYFTGMSDSTGAHLLRRTIGIAVGDYWLSCPTLGFGRLVAKNDNNSHVFQYYFTSKLGKPKFMCSEWMGSCHGDDKLPVFGVPFFKDRAHEFEDRERELSKHMIEVFTQFAKNGNPSTLEGSNGWPNYKSLNGHIIAPYYEITYAPEKQHKFGVGLKTNECENLWNKYIDKH